MEWLLLWPASIIFSTGYLFKAGTEFLNDIYESGYKINKKKLHELLSFTSIKNLLAKMPIPFYNIALTSKMVAMMKKSKEQIFDKLYTLGVINEDGEEEELEVIAEEEKKEELEADTKKENSKKIQDETEEITKNHQEENNNTRNAIKQEKEKLETLREKIVSEYKNKDTNTNITETPKIFTRKRI